jgi:hypothetical protein
MRRYHFDLIDTNNVTDVTGAVLDDDNHANRIALDLARDAREGRPDLMGHGYEIRVRTESGEEISRTALDLPQRMEMAAEPAEGGGRFFRGKPH